MTLQEQLIKSNWILVAYDFDSTTDNGNYERAELRGELVRKFRAKMMSQSVYFLPDTMASRATIERWARSHNATIFVFGADLDDAGQRRFAKTYLRYLKDLRKEMREIAVVVMTDLQDYEDALDKTIGTRKKVPSLKGWHLKIKAITNRFEELRKSIEKVGDKDDELELQMLSSYIEKIVKRYELVKKLKGNTS